MNDERAGTVQVDPARSGDAAALALPDAQPFTARLAGAGSLRREVEALIDAAPPGTGPGGFRDLLLRANVAGKASAASRMWAWKRLKLRYLLDPAVPEYRAWLAGMRESGSAANRGLLCFLMFARTDRLFREVTQECVSPSLARDGIAIDSAAVEAAVRARQAAGGLEWTKSTVEHIASHLLAALKDFGPIRGSRLSLDFAR